MYVSSCVTTDSNVTEFDHDVIVKGVEEEVRKSWTVFLILGCIECVRCRLLLPMSVSLSVCLSVTCDAASLDFGVQKQLNWLRFRLG